VSETLCRHPARQCQHLAHPPGGRGFEIGIADSGDRLDEFEWNLGHPDGGLADLVTLAPVCLRRKRMICLWQSGALSASPSGSATQAGSLLAGAGHVLRVAASVLVNALGRQFQHPIRQCGEEVPVV